MSELIIAERSDIVSIANAVRTKTQTIGELTLNEIIAGINSIEVGSGSSGNDLEVCTVTIDYIGFGLFMDGESIYYIDKNMTLQSYETNPRNTITELQVLKNSIICTDYPFESNEIQPILVSSGGGCIAGLITTDAEIVISS